jgi:adenylate cyclase
MKLKIRFTLLAAILILMVTSLGAVSAFVLLRNDESSRAISQLQIDQAAADIQNRIERFLEKGPLALTRMQRLVEGGFLNLDDSDRMETYLIAEMQADRDLTWLSYSSAGTGAFIGVTRREGMLILNRSALDVDSGRPREWEIRSNGTRLPLTARLQAPYDPRAAPWFLLGLEAMQPHWTDLYKFAEGEWGVSTVLRLRPLGQTGGVATSDFHLRVIDEFLGTLRVGQEGRAAVIVPQLAGDPVVLGGSSLPSVMRDYLGEATNQVAAAGRSLGSLDSWASRDLASSNLIAMNLRMLEPASGRPWFLAVMVPADEVNGPIRTATRDTLVVSAIFLTLGIAVAIWIANAITRPIRIMSEDLRRVGELRLSRTPPTRSFIQEMDTMSTSLSAMKACLRSFSFYVPVELVRSMLDSGREVEPGGETRVLTVLFTDIANFTKIAEALPPVQLSRDLGRYFDLLEEAVTRAGGLVDKFMGDGAMAFFNAPALLPKHAERACAAALSVQECLKDFNTQRKAEGLPPFRTRIGLALGPAVVGNIGTSRRLAYTAIGDVVNLSSHLEALNKVYGTSILADGGVQSEAGHGFEWRHLDRIAVAGRAAPVELFELLGRRGTVDASKLNLRDLHEAALGALIAGDFDTAERGFTAVLNAAPRDHAAGVLLAYTAETRRTLSAGEENEWSGVHVYSSRRPS